MASCPASTPTPPSSFGGSSLRALAQVLLLLSNIGSILCISCLQSCILGLSSLIQLGWPTGSCEERSCEKSAGSRQTFESSNGSSCSHPENETLREEAAQFLGQARVAELCESVALYEGRVWHERRHPVIHKFDYGVRYAFVNLDASPRWFLSCAAKNHMTSEDVRTIAGTRGTVYLLTMPTSVGYEQNPLSVYYCYGENGADLLKCVAEVTNTPWGERVTFLWDPKKDIVAKPLHVSPFMDMMGSWRMSASAPGPNLHITIQVQHPELGDYFIATLRLQRVDCKSIGSAESFLWLMPHKVALWIYWQALQLAWKGVAVQSHPKDIDGAAYRDRARARDSALLLSRPNLAPEETSEKKPRFFHWTDARSWPWR